jgi:hypothetical protein
MSQNPQKIRFASMSAANGTVVLRKRAVTLCVICVLVFFIPMLDSIPLLRASSQVSEEMMRYQSGTRRSDIEIISTRYSPITIAHYSILNYLAAPYSIDPSRKPPAFASWLSRVDPELLGPGAIESISDPVTRRCRIFASGQAFDSEDVGTVMLRSTIPSRLNLWKFLLYHEYAHCLQVDHSETGFLGGTLLKHYEEAFADAFATMNAAQNVENWDSSDASRLAIYRQSTAPVGSIHRTGDAILKAQAIIERHQDASTDFIVESCRSIALSDTISWLDEIDSKRQIPYRGAPRTAKERLVQRPMPPESITAQSTMQ